MNANMMRAKPLDERGALFVLLAGRALLMLCSVASIRLATQLLGPSQLGAMNLILSVITFFGLLVGAFSLYFYRQLLEWHVEGCLLENFARYGRFLIACSIGACVLMLIPYSDADGAWRGIPLGWLTTLLAGNLVVSTFNGATLYALNSLGKRRSYVLLSNVASWGGVGFAVGANMIWPARAEHWLGGLIAGQLLSLSLAWGAFVRIARDTAIAQPTTNRRADDFDLVAVLRFSWPLLICTGLYWVQRNSFAPLMASSNDLHTLGLFSVGFSVGLLIMSSFDTMVREYYSPIYYKAIAGRDDEAKVAAWNAYADALFPAVIAMSVFVGAAGGPLLRLLVSTEFHSMADAVVWGALSQVLISIYSTYVLLASSFMDNRILILPNVAGAAIVLALLIALLPLHPITGAGSAITLGLLTTTVLVAYRLSKHHQHVLPWRRMSSALMLAAPFALVPWIDRVIPYTLMVLSASGLYCVALQYRLAKRWL